LKLIVSGARHGAKLVSLIVTYAQVSAIRLGTAAERYRSETRRGEARRGAIFSLTPSCCDERRRLKRKAVKHVSITENATL